MRIVIAISILFFFYNGLSQQYYKKKVALVIGNKSYENSPLKNTLNDANDIAIKLEEKGFEVTKLLDATRKRIKKGLVSFSEKLEALDGEGIGLFYYSGHGIQVDGENYLIPIGSDINKKFEVEDECISASTVLRSLEYAENSLNIIILDACRNNPYRTFTRGNDSGFSKMDAPKGSILCYATSPGFTAEDGTGRNGTYTEVLLKHMDRPGVDLLNLFNDVSNEVRKKTQGNQIPWTSNSGIRKFMFTSENLEIVESINEKTPRLGVAKLLRTYGGINLKTELKGDLFLDGHLLGSVHKNTEVPIYQVKRGVHNIEIRGEQNWRKEINISKDQTLVVFAYAEDSLSKILSSKVDTINTSTNKKILQIENQELSSLQIQLDKNVPILELLKYYKKEDFYGKYYQGGIIFYINKSDGSGLIVAEEDQSSGAEWGCAGTLIEGAHHSQKGSGQLNTMEIINSCKELEIAALLCENLLLEGFNDWFLPSKEELATMDDNLFRSKGGIGKSAYWSSTQKNKNLAWYYDFNSGVSKKDLEKNNTLRVRAIRAFK